MTSPNIPATLAKVRSELAAAADPKFREGQRWFFKEEVDAWGVRRAALEPIVRELYKAIRNWPAEARDELFARMWRSGRLEEGVIVCHVSRRFPREFGRDRFEVYAKWIDHYVTNWAHCDGVASWLLAGCIREEPELARKLELWTRSRNRWKRRAAAVALLQEAKAGREIDQILRITSMLAEDDDLMVQKGLGWVLKEAYPRHPEDVVLFLHHQRERFSRLTLRYAAEKMTAMHRKVIMRPEAVTRKQQ
jgi:3-methyladenine DNA glycosylase AlkD